MLYKYKKEIDTKIKPAVEKSLKVKVDSAKKINAGEVNHVYKVDTDQGVFIARVFKNEYWPEEKKLLWIDQQLKKHKISHAKILFHTRTGPQFPYGFMITEFIPGMMAKTAVKKDVISNEQFYTEVARVLKKVHSIKTKKFGNWKTGLGHNKNFIDELQNNAKSRLQDIKYATFYSKSLEEKVSEEIKNLLTPMKRKLKPVLTHGDPGGDNCIWGNDQELTVIDWDNALSSIWIRDYADLTYWGIKKPSLGKNEKQRHQKIQKAFFKGYGKTNFTQNEIKKAEKALHLYQAVNLMKYYYTNKRMKMFSDSKKRLYSLLGI